MNAELKAYVEAVAGERLAPRQRELGILSAIAYVLRDWLRNGEAFYCELRPTRRVKEAVARCCRRHQAIGYHGLA